MLAARSGHASTVRQLLGRGALADAVDKVVYVPMVLLIPKKYIVAMPKDGHFGGGQSSSSCCCCSVSVWCSLGVHQDLPVILLSFCATCGLSSYSVSVLRAVHVWFVFCILFYHGGYGCETRVCS